MCEWIKARYRPLIAVAQDNGGDKTVGPKPLRSLAEERRNG
jgi:hypothetical protein